MQAWLKRPVNILGRDTGMKGLDDNATQHIAQYFQALSERTRLKLLFALRGGEMNVTELTESSGCSQANVSKHMTHLTKAGFVQRETRGTSVYYRVADPDIFALCDMVSGKIADLMAAQRAVQTLLRNVSAKGKRIIAGKAKKQD
jgi:DNA-binding transcriptional ArsR family regulator